VQDERFAPDRFLIDQLVWPMINLLAIGLDTLQNR
jgi:hypothetical protein